MKDNLRARNLDVGDSVKFDPPIRFNQYIGGCDSEDGPAFEGYIESVEVLGKSEFCLIDEVDGADSYTKYVIEDCVETGTIESYYTCESDSCDDCTLEVIAHAPLYANRSDVGICYNYTYSTDVDNVDSLFDASTSFSVQTEFVVDLDDIEEGEVAEDLEDITNYINMIVDNSCIDEGALVIVDEDEVIVVDAEGETSVVDIECTSVLDLACAAETPDFTILCSLLTAYPDITKALEESAPFTVFAPTDEAFQAIEDVSETLSEEQIGDIIKFHAYIGSSIAFEDLECKERIEMANGYESRTKCVGLTKGQKGGGNIAVGSKLPMIIKPDIEACGGIVHVIDAVMLPNWVKKMME